MIKIILLVSFSIFLLVALSAETFRHPELQTVCFDPLFLDWDDHYLLNQRDSHLPTHEFRLIKVRIHALNDQGVITSIFRPPASIL